MKRVILYLLLSILHISFSGDVSAIELNLPISEEAAPQNSFADMEISPSLASFREDKIPGSLICQTYDLSRLKNGNDSGILPGKAGEAMVNTLVKRFTEIKKLNYPEQFSPG